MKICIYAAAIALALTGYADATLREDALKYGLEAVPAEFSALQKMLGKKGESLSPEKVELGKKLFNEKALSLDRTLSCASCHNLDKGGIDGEETAVGYERRRNPFHLNTPTVLNTALSTKLFWDGRSSSLEEQAQGPMIASFEMAASPLLIEERLNAMPAYTEAFARVYGTPTIAFVRVTDAIGAYERTLVTRGRFDRFLEGEEAALDHREQRGLKLFMERGCVGCHNGPGLGGGALRKFPIMRHNIWSLSDTPAINTLRSRFEAFLDDPARSGEDVQRRYDALLEAVGEEGMALLKEGYFGDIPAEEQREYIVTKGCFDCHERGNYRIARSTLQSEAYPFENKGGFLGSEGYSRYFRVPLLRNIVSTRPYFHNGGIEKLEDAIRLMSKHQMRKAITDDEVKAMVAFFKAVDGELVRYDVE